MEARHEQGEREGERQAKAGEHYGLAAADNPGVESEVPEPPAAAELVDRIAEFPGVEAAQRNICRRPSVELRQPVQTLMTNEQVLLGGKLASEAGAARRIPLEARPDDLPGPKINVLTTQLLFDPGGASYGLEDTCCHGISWFSPRRR